MRVSERNPSGLWRHWYLGHKQIHIHYIHSCW